MKRKKEKKCGKGSDENGFQANRKCVSKDEKYHHWQLKVLGVKGSCKMMSSILLPESEVSYMHIQWQEYYHLL